MKGNFVFVGGRGLSETPTTKLSQTWETYSQSPLRKRKKEF